MKVYFMSSPRGKEKFEGDYKKINRAIVDLGHTLTTDFLLQVDVGKFYVSDVDEFFEATIQDLKKADVCVFEATTPSLAVGYLINEAIKYGKPVIVLFAGKEAPHFLKGIHDDAVQIIPYDIESVSETLSFALNYAKDKSDVRFNFFISPSIGTYLDWISKNKNIPRSVYLRTLIEKDMAANKEYNA